MRSTMVSIGGYGAYVPLYRIKRSTIAEQHGGYSRDGEISVPSYDEDHITMGIKAGKQALSHADVGGEEIDAVYTASVSDPFDEHGLAPHIGYALGADGDSRAADFGGSARAATTAIQSAADAIEAGRINIALIVGVDILSEGSGSSAERTAGAGAGALLLQEQDGNVATLEGIANETTGFVGKFTVSGQTTVEGDATFNREAGYLDAVPGAIERLVEAGFTVEPKHVALPSRDNSWGDRALKTADLAAERHSTFDAIGNAGAASVLLDGVAAFEEASAGDQVLIASYGPGGSDALLIEASSDVETQPEMTLQDYIEHKEYVTYAKHRKFREQVGGDA